MRGVMKFSVFITFVALIVCIFTIVRRVEKLSADVNQLKQYMESQELWQKRYYDLQNASRLERYGGAE